MLDPRVRRIGDGSNLTAGGVRLCFGCRAAGSCKLGVLSERLEDDRLVCEVRCPESFEGGPGVAHGGWTAAALDEVLGHVAGHFGEMAVTGTITVRYDRPVPVALALIARAWVIERTATKWVLAGELRTAATGERLAAVDGVWVVRDPQAHFERFSAWLAAGSDA